MITSKEIAEKLMADWQTIKPLYKDTSNELLKAKYKGMLEQITRTFGYKIREDIYANYPELIKELQEIGIDVA